MISMAKKGADKTNVMRVLEQKKMIACQLFDRIELGRDYHLTLHMNVTYKQFCTDLKTKENGQNIA